MVCYMVPLATTIGVALGRRKLNKHDAHGFWLSIMLLGGSLFGVVDHMWNGELFLLGPNLMLDMALGGVITTGIFAAWGIIVFRERLAQPFRGVSRHLGITS